MAEKSLFDDKEYRVWVKELKDRIRGSQVKALVRVNSSMLELYWSIGADIVNKQAESKWGSGVIRNLSQELRGEFSDASGFSETNLKYMKRFYLTYSRSSAAQQSEKPIALIGQRVVDQLSAEDSLADYGNDQDALPAIMASVPWGQHIEIFTRSKSVEEAVFYVAKTVENGWSRATLKDYIKSDLYARQGKAPNNFTRLLPMPQSALAGEMLKDPYSFDFIALRDKYIERELEDALVDNVTKLLLEMGRGFAYLGRQVKLMAGSKELSLDLLCYHVHLHCYVVVELKVDEFEAADVGQLGAYVAAVNHQMRSEGDNPTIGLLICRSKDTVYAGYALESSSQPIGISEYQLAESLPKELESSLPSIGEIEARLKDE
jgi:predicted nuclease of restriction endonuclease-like (RecB) superfamily